MNFSVCADFAKLKFSNSVLSLVTSVVYEVTACDFLLVTGFSPSMARSTDLLMVYSVPSMSVVAGL